MIFAYQASIGAYSRMMADAHAGVPVLTLAQRRHPPGLDTDSWCLADKPEPDGVEFVLAPVRLGDEVPEDAFCETCGASIRELQANLRDSLAAAGRATGSDQQTPGGRR